MVALLVEAAWCCVCGSLGNVSKIPPLLSPLGGLCVYDIDASPGYAVNNGKVGDRRFPPNVRIEMPQSRESFLAWFVARAAIAPGSQDEAMRSRSQKIDT